MASTSGHGVARGSGVTSEDVVRGSDVTSGYVVDARRDVRHTREQDTKAEFFFYSLIFQVTNERGVPLYL